MARDEVDLLADAKAASQSAVVIRCRADLPTLPDTAEVEIFYCEESLGGSAGSLLQLTHSGLQASCKAASLPSTTLQYFGVTFGSDVLVPRIVDNGAAFEWRNDSVVTCASRVLSHWQSTRRVGTLLGRVWNAYCDWVVGYTALQPGYQMWDIWSAPDGLGARWLNGCKCDEFVEASLLKLHDLGGLSDGTQMVLYKNYIPLLSAAQPELLDIVLNASHAAVAVAHFASLTELIEAGHSQMPLPALMRQISERFDTWVVYERSTSRYWRIALTPPYLALDRLYQPLQLPWQQQNTALQHKVGGSPGSTASAPTGALELLRGIGTRGAAVLQERAGDLLLSRTQRSAIIAGAVVLSTTAVLTPALLGGWLGVRPAAIYAGGVVNGMLAAPCTAFAFGLYKLRAQGGLVRRVAPA